MDLMNRREFLGQAILAGAGSTFLHGFPLPLTESDDSDYDPGFVAGRVLSLTDGLMTVLDPDEQVRKAQIGSSSLLWKQGAWNSAPLAQGDCAYTRGSPREDGVIDVEALWVDIHSVAGTYLAHDDTHLVLLTLDGVESTLSINGGTSYKGVDGATAPLEEVELSKGDLLQLIAFGDSKVGGALTATSVFGLGADESSGEQDSSLESTTFLRLASWFCCGMVAGCGSGSCGAGGGACGTCRTDRRHMAWPRLSTTGCNTCNGLDCCTSLPPMPCNSTASVRNPCPDITRTITLKDCGPSAHTHASVGCANRSCLMFDLTACAFTSVGGSLSAGIINVNVTV
jgi:hypothetical protein